MPGSDLMLAFFAAAFVFAVMPGPALLYTAAQTLARGRRGGMMAVLGIHIGGWVHVVAAAFGLALLFAATPWIYAALKIVGALYLIYLGLRLMFRLDEGAGDAPAKANPAFWQSISVEVLNPKTALFFLAFLPQFTDPGAAFPLWLQLLILGTIVNVMFSLADVVAVLLAETVRHRLQRDARLSRWSQRAGGSLLVFLGARLALGRD